MSFVIENKEIDIDPSSSRILLYNDFMRFWVPDAHSSVVQGDKFPTDLNEEMHYRHVDDTCREQTCKVQDLTLYTANKFEKDDNVRAQDQNGVLFDCRIAEFSVSLSRRVCYTRLPKLVLTSFLP